MTKIILATTSTSRREAFRFLDLDFVAEGSDVDEYSGDRPNTPKELTLHLAKLKAEAIAKNHSQGIVIGFDSVGWFDGKILEKPRSRKEAFERLRSFSGKPHQYCTGIHMINLESGKVLSRNVVTDVQIRVLTDADINKYLDQDPKLFSVFSEGFDPLEHYSSSFVKRIDGSYNNLTRGIPLEVIVEMLPEIGYTE